MAFQSIDKVLREYEQLRSRQNAEKYARINAAYKQAPELLEITQEISNAGLKNAMSIAKDVENADKYNAQLEKELKALDKRREDILKKYNIPENFDQAIHKCTDCGDTGFVNGRRCKCLLSKMVSMAYESSNMGELLKTQNFDNFRFDYYADKLPDGTSPLLSIKQAYAASVKLCNEFSTYDKNLLFYGSSGLGKTFLSSCIAKKLLDCGYSCIYVRSTQLISLHDDYKFGRGDEEKNADAVNDIFNCDLLIIDDLGVEALNKSSLAFVLDIINDRLINNKKIIISTNLSIDELSKQYTPRFISRVYESFLPLKFIGQDIRKQKLIEQK